MDEMKRLPVVALRGLTILPEVVAHFDVSREKSLGAVSCAMRGDEKLFVVAQRDVEVMDPSREDLFDVGCIVTIKQVVKLPQKMSRVLISADCRARLLNLKVVDGSLMAIVEEMPDEDTLEEEIGASKNPLNLEAMTSALKDLYKSFMERNPKIGKEMRSRIETIQDFRKLVDVVGANLPMDYKEAQTLLEEVNIMRRYEMLTARLVKEIQIADIKEELQRKVKVRVDKSQREYILREEMKVIREELGDDHTLNDADDFQKKCDELEAPDEVKNKISKEIKRFRNTMNSPSEMGVIRTYIETMLEMPWDHYAPESVNIKKAEKILNADHYGLEKVKERILEFMAVRALTKKGDSPILCLVGPPGTGKTSIAKSLARALDKPYVRISLGGIRDEAEIRGHRKTYVGAMPGRIADAIRSAGVKNPLMLLDEIDKVSNDYKGDTFSALLEVLDSEQNNKFRDHYLEVPLDLSEVLFVTTANDLHTIPRPLLDRMEVIEVSGYTENEKMHIVLEHLLPKQRERNGLKGSQLTISKKAITRMARSYTKESGVRQLERKIAQICRKAAREIFESQKKTVRVTEKNLTQFLGKEIYSYQKANKDPEIGIVRGLAWTAVGGDTLQIEVNVMPGEGEIQLTGQLGDVMKESARTGISFIRSISSQYEIPEDFFKKHDIHIHIPEGAVPKDGPSAGITMATAIFSAATGRPVRADVAMTGEITLRGRVLPIGGLKEKMLAAKMAGIKTVLVPKENMADVDEFSEEITSGLKIIPVSEMKDVLKNALVAQ